MGRSSWQPSTLASCSASNLRTGSGLGRGAQLGVHTGVTFLLSKAQRMFVHKLLLPKARHSGSSSQIKQRGIGTKQWIQNEKRKTLTNDCFLLCKDLDVSFSSICWGISNQYYFFLRWRSVSFVYGQKSLMKLEFPAVLFASEFRNDNVHFRLMRSSSKHLLGTK